MPWTLTVSELNDYVRRTLASDPALRFLSLRGEISDFKKYASGHWYFTLKDEACMIQCVCFRQYNMRLDFRPENGILCFAVCVMKIGSRAIFRCEPCQVLTEAAVSAREDVLQGCPV